MRPRTHSGPPLVTISRIGCQRIDNLYAPVTSNSLAETRTHGWLHDKPYENARLIMQKDFGPVRVPYSLWLKNKYAQRSYILWFVHVLLPVIWGPSTIVQGPYRYSYEPSSPLGPMGPVQALHEPRRAVRGLAGRTVASKPVKYPRGANTLPAYASEPRHDSINKVSVCPAKTQISLGIRPVWSVFAVRMKKPWFLSYPLSAQRRLWSDWADAQADLSLR